jgi:nucleoside-diphosphate-sugar epimerase
VLYFVILAHFLKQLNVMKHAVIIGYGDTGIRVAKMEIASQQTVYALTRNPDRTANDVRLFLGDLDHPESIDVGHLQRSYLYYFAPPQKDGQTDQRLRGLLRRLSEKKVHPSRIVYISTTAVYGDCSNNWIDESQPTQPANDRGRRRLDAEQAVQEFGRETGTEWVILRVAGIYGPGKLPIERIRSGQPILRREDSPATNRIHIDDLAAICFAAMHRSQPGEIYNVADGNPSTMADYFLQLAQLCNLPAPPSINWEEAQKALSPAMLSFLKDGKRIKADKLKTGLEIELQYPDLESGLQQAVSATFRE